jgi:transcriptional regulator with XRE-family HTH domain
MNFGEWLKYQRTSRRYSLDELADLIGYSKSYLNRIERNLPHPTSGASPQPTRKFVKAVATALAIPLEDALKAAGYAPRQTEVLVGTIQEGQIVYEPLDPDDAKANERLASVEEKLSEVRDMLASLLKQFPAKKE